MGKKGKRKVGECAYCGIEAELSRDHVISRGFFGNPLPSYMPTVPSCDKCNNQKSQDEGYLRDLLVLDLNGSQHPVANQLFSDKVLRSVSRPESPLGRAIVTQGRSVNVFTPSGLELVDHGFKVPIDSGREASAISRIVRGLYYHERGRERLPDSYTIEVRRAKAGKVDEYWRSFEETGFGGRGRLGEGVFVVQYAFLDNDPGVSMWALLFYEAVLYIAITDSPNRRITSRLNAGRSQSGLLTPLIRPRN